MKPISRAMWLVVSPKLQLGEALAQCLPVSLVYHLFVGPPVLEISVSQWVGHFLGANLNAFLSHPVKLISQMH